MRDDITELCDRANRARDNDLSIGCLIQAVLLLSAEVDDLQRVGTPE